MEIKEEQLKSSLLESGKITNQNFEEIKKQAQKEPRSFEEILISKNLISEEELSKLFIKNFKFPFVLLSKRIIPETILKIIPEPVALKEQTISFERDSNGLKVATLFPENQEFFSFLAKKTGDKIIPYYAPPVDIQNALLSYQKKVSPEDIIKKDISKIEKGQVELEETPLIEIVDSLLKYAHDSRASDAHIEPRENETVVRFRIDGVMHSVLKLPKKIHDLIVTRIKVLSKLRTDEHFKPQDGKFQVALEDETFDVRVSIVPVSDGEKIVMRLLSEKARRFTLEDLGLKNSDFKRVQIAIKKPWGMILATGPTGCGKTTSLYAVLQILNQPEVNICTIEDPVEYDIEGVNQIQVNLKSGLTFARGLRAIVRQDPDIIMVGEIRDEESAKIAVESAMTGHLVLSTLHTNNAAGTLPRLIGMGIEPFLVASSINVIIAQRLVRKICPLCHENYKITPIEFESLTTQISQDILKRVFRDKDLKRVSFSKGKGCKVCNNTGYQGRIGIFEVLEVKENIKELIMKQADADQLQEAAIKNGTVTMVEDGLYKVLDGTTTFEEVLRVVRE